MRILLFVLFLPYPLIANPDQRSVATELAPTGVQTKGINKEEIRSVVQKHLSEIKGCYESIEKVKSGKIVINWDINDQGKVTRANIKSTTLNSKDIEDCAVEKLKAWEFPKAPKGKVANVNYPFVFQSATK